VDHVPLVAVERLEEKSRPRLLRALAELLERRTEVIDRRGPINSRVPATLHRTQDRRGAEAARQVDDRGHELAPRAADAVVGIRQRELAKDRARAGPHRGEPESVILQAFLKE